MKFTIRELFLVTVIVALALGWCLERHKRAHWEHRALLEGRNISMLLKHVDPGELNGFEHQWYFEIKEKNAAALRELYTEPEAILPSLPNSSTPAPNLPKK